MFGALVLLILAAYIGIWWFLVTRFKNRWAKSAVVLVALAIPFWEVPVGYANFYLHCANEAGVRVSKNLKPVDSILMDPSAMYTPEEIFRLGFKTAEYIQRGQTIRYVPSAKGRSSSIHAAPISTIKVHSSGSQSLAWNLTRSDTAVSSITTGEVLATQTYFRWGPLWWQELATPMLGGGTYCFGGHTKSMLAIVAGKD